MLSEGVVSVCRIVRAGPCCDHASLARPARFATHAALRSLSDISAMIIGPVCLQAATSAASMSQPRRLLGRGWLGWMALPPVLT